MRIHESVTEGGSVAAGAPMAPMYVVEGSERCWREQLHSESSKAVREQHERKNKYVP
jgi:hypothetical protein